MKNTTTNPARKITALKFLVLENARSFANRCHKAHAVVVGDDNRFWVVTLADLNRLAKLGFELAR